MPPTTLPALASLNAFIRSVPHEALPPTPEPAAHPSAWLVFVAQTALRCRDDFTHLRHDPINDGITGRIACQLGAMLTVLARLNPPYAPRLTDHAPFPAGDYAAQAGVAGSIAVTVGRAAAGLNRDAEPPDGEAMRGIREAIRRALAETVRLTTVGGVSPVPASFAMPELDSAWQATFAVVPPTCA